MTVYEMNIFQTLCFTYLCKNGNTPSIFNYICTLKPINKYTTRSKSELFKPLCKNNFTKFKLSYRGSHLWNSFPRFRASCNFILVLFHVTDIVCFYVKPVFMSQKMKNKQTNKKTKIKET